MLGVHKKLGRYIIAAFFLNIFAIMSVGAMCILLVGDMLHNIQDIKTESSHVFTADTISNKVYKIIYAIDKSIIANDESHLNYASNIIVDIIDEVSTFIAAGDWENHDQSELEKLNRILSLLIQIRDTITDMVDGDASMDPFEGAAVRKLEKLGLNVQVMSEELREHHTPIINSLVDDSFHKMRFILFLYLVSSLIGVLASVVGYTVLTRNTITPIMHLAHATRKVAHGDLSVRVATDSETEIGALYDSFNTMTEKLELHAREREEFNRQLEEIVLHRTRELREANESLQKTQSELVRMEKIATLGEIAASVNHEIKTPLNSLYLNLQLLTRKINKQEWPEEETRNTLLTVTTTIDNEIRRISDILEEFVLYARFAPPNLREEDLNMIIGELKKILGETARKSGVELNILPCAGSLPAQLDSKKITQALLNLCVNAIQAMPEGGRLTVRSGRTPDGASIVTVTDNGTGIGPDDLEKIFEPFFTKKEKGMGFGLPIVRRIIEDHKGTITCTSKLGEYTEFEIILPGFADQNQSSVTE